LAILWLASFPKSGNTWIRSLLANYFSNDNNSFELNRLADFTIADNHLWIYERASGKDLANAELDEFMALRPAAQAILADVRPGLVFVKSHSAFAHPSGQQLIAREHTAGAVCVLRNPLDIVASFADHFGLSVEDAALAMSDPYLKIGAAGKRAAEFLGDWSSHVGGWTGADGLKKVVVRYEDMHADPGAALARVLHFIRTPIEPERVERAVAQSSFEALSAQEAAAGFRERSPNSAAFFRVGRPDVWRDALTPALARQIVDAHGPAMRAAGYLDAEGRPVPAPTRP